MKKILPGIVLTLLLIGLLTFAVNIQPAKATEHITIHEDGSITPPDAHISNANNVSYGLTDDIFDTQIVIQKDNIIIAGCGHWLNGNRVEAAISLAYRSNVTVVDMQISNFGGGIYVANSSSSNNISGNLVINCEKYGIGLFDSCECNFISNNFIRENGDGIDIVWFSDNNTVTGNIIVNNTLNGIYLYKSWYNNISRNLIVANQYYGIQFVDSDDNIVWRNNITHSDYGVFLYSSYSNLFHHNNFISNTHTPQAGTDGSGNYWDDGFEGNYWSDYNGTDADGDGIGDTEYKIDVPNNIDYHPLMKPCALLTGDINGDSKVDVKDLVLVIKHFGSYPGCQTVEPKRRRKQRRQS